MQNKINGQRRFNWILTCSSLAHNFNYIKHDIKLYSNNLFGRIPIRKTFLLCSRGLYFFVTNSVCVSAIHFMFEWQKTIAEFTSAPKRFSIIWPHIRNELRRENAPKEAIFQPTKLTRLRADISLFLTRQTCRGYIQQKLKRLSSSVLWNWNFANGVIDRKTNSMKNVFEKS